MFYYMHNNTNYQCKICWNKALTFGVGSIQLSFRIYIYHCVHPIHANMFSIQILLHFSQIMQRVCTLVLSFYHKDNNHVGHELLLLVPCMHLQVLVLLLAFATKSLDRQPLNYIRTSYSHAKYLLFLAFLNLSVIII